MASVTELTHQAGFVFEAQLLQMGASTSAAYPSGPDTAIVRVTKLLKATPALAGYEGQLVTVQLQSAGTHQVGQQSVFFTDGIHYGDGLVVAEIGTVGGGVAAMEPDFNTAVQSSQDIDMTQRLAQAELVVTGVASEPRPFAPQAATVAAAVPARRVSEHDPDWCATTITVESVEKGSHAGKTVDVIYPNSRDVVWFRAPKVQAGDHGVWLLHNRDHHGKPVPALAVTHPLDFRPIEEAPHVRNLLKQ